MTYEQFVERMEERVRAALAPGRSVRLRSALKNNGRHRKGLVFTEAGVNTSPTIYLEEYYERYQAGSSFEEVAGQILALYGSVRMDRSWDGERLSRYENVKPRLICRLINRERNRDLLEEVPHVPYLDLAVVFHVLVDLEADDRIATMLVRREHLKWWHVTEEEVRRAAGENTEKLLPAEFKTLCAVLAQAGMEEPPVQADPAGAYRMYVLTNSIQNFGASAILYKDVLKKIGAFLKEDFYVLPSSIHEVIILPESSAPSWRETAMIVKEINETQVMEEEVLSDTPYFYRRSEGALALPGWEKEV